MLMCSLLQEKHEQYKAEADARAKALTEEADQLRSSISELETEISSLKRAERSAKDQSETDRQQLRDEISSLNVSCLPPAEHMCHDWLQ